MGSNGRDLSPVLPRLAVFCFLTHGNGHRYNHVRGYGRPAR